MKNSWRIQQTFFLNKVFGTSQRYAGARFIRVLSGASPNPCKVNSDSSGTPLLKIVSLSKHGIFK